MHLRTLWLAAALVLLAVAAWLMSSDDKMTQEPDLDRVDFPAAMRTSEYERAEKRKRALPPPRLPALDPPDPELVTTDPMLRALPDDARSTVVVEANAIRHSPLGQLFIDCLRSGEHDPFADIQKQIGVDVLEDLDRIAVADDAMLISGHFGDARWNEIFAAEDAESYGDRGTLYCGGPECVGVWGGELLIAGRDREAIASAIDRIEGRAEVSPPIGDHQTYGEIYGVIDPEQLAELLPSEQGGIAATIRQVVSGVGLHVDATGDVAMVADLAGEDDERLADLGKSMGSALAIARMAAKAQGEDELAELLSYTRVSADGVSVELALPQALLQEHLEAICREHHDARRAAEEVDGEAPEASED